MTKYIVAYNIKGVLAVEAEDERKARDIVADYTETVTGSVETGLVVVPMEFLP